MTQPIELTGCTPTPLASYLKALAVLRLVAEAGADNGGDSEAAGFWREDVFVLRTKLTKEELRAFFLGQYRPTPLIAPWGARSGFFAGSSEKTAREALSAISKSADDRLEPFRNTISTVRNLLSKHGFDEKASDEKKSDLLNLCRAKLPDHILPWLDACYVLTSEGRKFPPLLGTGGNEGSGSYVSGFAQQVVACIVKRGHDHALASALFGIASSDAYSDQTPGHFSPQGSGGANASIGFEGNIQFNAWDYLLCLEGTLFFASASTRKHEFDAPQINFPFVVAPTAAGHGSYVITEERPKQAKRQVMEIWLPLWERPAGLDELKAMFSEGRATLRERKIANGLDFARALAGFGIDRGLTSFQRFAFLMRNGQSFFAAALDRYRVKRNADVDLVAELERRNWLGLVQRYARDKNAPNAFRTAAYQLDTALFALTQQANRTVVQTVLRRVGGIEATISLSAKAQKEVPPAPQLGSRWLSKYDDPSAAYRIAAALAGLRLSGRKQIEGRLQVFDLTARHHLVAINEKRSAWDRDSRLAVWGPGPLTGNIAALLHRRRLEAIALGAEGEVLASQTGATRDDVATFLDSDTDDARIGELLGGLACVDWSDDEARRITRGTDEEAVLPPAFTLLKVFFTPESVLHALKWLPPDRSFRLPAEIPARLAGDDAQAAVRIAWQRLRALGVKLPGRNPPQVVGAHGPRWLAALCIPLAFVETKRLLRGLDLSPEFDPDATEPPKSSRNQENRHAQRAR
jgi:CRISPR-associated protein Csx17